MGLIKNSFFSPYSFFFWLNRFTYLGITAAGLYFHNKFGGEHNFSFPVSDLLVPVSIFGLLAHELGLRVGNLIRTRKKPRNYLRSYNQMVPLAIWGISIFMSLGLFYFQGIPLLTDPMRRAEIGQGMGLLKRALTIFLPMAALELNFIFVKTKRHKILTLFVVMLTLLMLFFLTAKGSLFFFIVYLMIVYYHLKLRYVPNFFQKTINKRNLYLLIGFGLTCYLYSIYVLGGASFIRTMTVRVTNSIAQAPNYILLKGTSSFTAEELINNDIAGIMKTFRIPGEWSVRQLDSELTSVILNRPVLAGGINPTVIGYGWILGGWFGVLGLSMLYGCLMGYYVKTLMQADNPLVFVVCIYSSDAVFAAVHVFSPVFAFLNIGVSVIMYIVTHRILARILLAPIVNMRSHGQVSDKVMPL